MGHYLNPGNEGFKRALRGRIYVDKSGMIKYINDVLGTDDGFVCVSRPRRFGKSMAANMLAAYYDRTCDSTQLFETLDISKTEDYKKHLNQHHVIFLNMQQILSSAGSPEQVPAFLQKSVLEEVREVYPEYVSDTEKHLPTVLAGIYAKNPAEHKGFIFIIDEWDCIFREAKSNISAQKEYLEFLRDLLKDRTYVSAAYMTGILPIKKYGTHSALNIFKEFSMTDPDVLVEYVGFTEKEVMDLCSEYGKNFEEIKHWYDGYHFGVDTHIYNPKSVVDAMKSQRLKSFWVNTETYEALQMYIDLDLDGLKEALVTMLAGEECRIDTGTFQNDMTSFKSRDDVLTLLVHLGYLAYDETKETVFIPNEEVRQEFLRAVKGGRRQEIAKIIRTSDQLLQDTLSGNEEAVAEAIENAHLSGTVPLFYNNEQALRSVIKLAYISCVDEFQTIQELPTGKGYADIVFLPKKESDMPMLLVELKWNKTAEGAIAQIKDKKYPDAWKNYGSKILLVGISYHEKTKIHTCKIETYRLNS